MTSSDRISVALLTNASAPYRTPFFNELAQQCSLLISFDAEREPEREWSVDEQDFEFRHIRTRAISITRSRARHGFAEDRVLRVPLDIVPALERAGPDVVISAELGFRTAWAALFCRLRNRPLIVWWEGTYDTEVGTSGLKVALRRQLLKRAARVWANGEGSARFLRANGVPESRIDLGMTGTDTAYWRREVDREHASRAATRERLGLRGAVILFTGRLQPLKGVRELLAALSLLTDEAELPAWSVLFVGAGPLDREIETWARAHPDVPVASVGFVQPEDLAQYYAAADVFAMPSLDDVWGLVCLEALVAGLPQVTSSLAGAAPDLVTSNEIGSVVDPRDLRALADALADRLSMSPTRVPEPLREHAVAKWSTTAMTERAMSSIRAALR
jgi:glycosyltransferase involved in cell wall biosynthesis